MCDLDTQKDAEDFLNSKGELSRRKFNKLTATAGLAMLLPPPASSLPFRAASSTFTRTTAATRASPSSSSA